MVKIVGENKKENEKLYKNKRKQQKRKNIFFSQKELLKLLSCALKPLSLVMEKVCFGDGSFGVNKKVKGLNKRKQGVEKKKRLHQKENGRSSPRK